jgi:hypothetical protein
MSVCFADDGVIAGTQGEVLRAIRHLKAVLPRVGLEFSKLEATPASAGQSTIDRVAFESSGVFLNMSGNMVVMKAPVGDDDFMSDFCDAEGS